MTHGYSRISTDEQSTALQRDALAKAGCSRVWEDRGITGAHTRRPQLQRCLKALGPGDTLIVWKLDRLGRSLQDLISMLDDLKGRGVTFRSITEHVDTETPTGRAMWQMIGILAELERSMIAERTKAGVIAAKKRGVKFGRKALVAGKRLEYAKSMLRTGHTAASVAEMLGVSRATVYRAVRMAGWDQPQAGTGKGSPKKARRAGKG